MDRIVLKITGLCTDLMNNKVDCCLKSKDELTTGQKKMLIQIQALLM